MTFYEILLIFCFTPEKEVWKFWALNAENDYDEMQ